MAEPGMLSPGGAKVGNGLAAVVSVRGSLGAGFWSVAFSGAVEAGIVQAARFQRSPEQPASKLASAMLSHKFRDSAMTESVPSVRKRGQGPVPFFGQSLTWIQPDPGRGP